MALTITKSEPIRKLSINGTEIDITQLRVNMDVTLNYGKVYEVMITFKAEQCDLDGSVLMITQKPTADPDTKRV